MREGSRSQHGRLAKGRKGRASLLKVGAEEVSQVGKDRKKYYY